MGTAVISNVPALFYNSFVQPHLCITFWNCRGIQFVFEFSILCYICRWVTLKNAFSTSTLCADRFWHSNREATKDSSMQFASESLLICCLKAFYKGTNIRRYRIGMIAFEPANISWAAYSLSLNTYHQLAQITCFHECFFFRFYVVIHLW